MSGGGQRKERLEKGTKLALLLMGQYSDIFGDPLFNHIPGLPKLYFVLFNSKVVVELKFLVFHLECLVSS